MKVLSLVTNRYATFYQNQIAALEKLGVSFTHLSPPQQSPDHGERQDISRTKTDYAKLYADVLREATSEYDVVHANYGLMAPYALAQPHRPTVLTLWGSDLSGYVGFLSKACADCFDSVIVMSEEMNQQLGRDAHVIPHGIDMDLFKPMPQSDARTAVGWDPDTNHVLFPYDPSREVKNYPLAERVVDEARQELSETTNLQVVYGIDHEDVPLYMNAADALLLTSRREGFPNSVKEAMSCNLPVVSTDVGPLREQLDGIDNSYVCSSEAALVERLVDVLETGRRSNGREHAASLSLDRMADQIYSIYRNQVA